MPSDAACKMKRTEIIDQKVPGQKDMFAPVLPEVPGHMTRCPCGFGAYAGGDWTNDVLAKSDWNASLLNDCQFQWWWTTMSKWQGTWHRVWTQSVSGETSRQEVECRSAAQTCRHASEQRPANDLQCELFATHAVHCWWLTAEIKLYCLKIISDIR